MHISYVWQAKYKVFEGDTRLISDPSVYSGHQEMERNIVTGAFRLYDIFNEKQAYLVFKEFCRLELNHENPMFFPQCHHISHKYREFAQNKSIIKKELTSL